MRMRHKLCYTAAISGACCLHNQCSLLSPLSSSCVQGLPFHSPVYNTSWHACVLCVQVCDGKYPNQVQQGVSEASLPAYKVCPFTAPIYNTFGFFSLLQLYQV